jgi:signal transduction histidine kinase
VGQVSVRDDRRAGSRRRVSRRAFVSDPEGRFYYYCFIREASRQGCRIYSPDVAELPGTLWLFPEGFTAPLLGRIAWRNAKTAGVEFTVELPGGRIADGAGGKGPSLTFGEIGERIAERKAALSGTFRPQGGGANEEMGRRYGAGNLLAIVVHELKTPITSILGALSLIAARALDALPEKFQHLVQIALRNSKRMQRLVGDLLEAERLESGKLAIELAPADLNRVAREAVEADSQFAAMHHVSCRLETPEQPAIANIDAGRIQQVLSNLISNAVKFSRAGQEVVVRVERTGALIRVSVIDQGIGIARDAQARIFNRFGQAGGAGSAVQKGTGLGLSICRSILRLHGAQIRLDSEPGRGSTFSFELPAAGHDHATGARAA